MFPTRRRRLSMLLALAAFAVTAACAAVADLDVEHDRGPLDNQDESGVREDARSTADPHLDGAPPPVNEAAADAPPVFAACSCPVSEGCCVPASGKGTCAPPANVGVCTAAGGIYLRCVAGDLDNGRACCLANDLRSSFYSADECRDAGARLCANDDDCPIGKGLSCQTSTCREVLVHSCAPEGGPFPECPR